ncbi:hypothetical protein ACE5KN_21160 [Paenibacillus terreus]
MYQGACQKCAIVNMKDTDMSLEQIKEYALERKYSQLEVSRFTVVTR